MNAINGRVHILDPDTRADLDALALIRQQKSRDAAYIAILEAAAVAIERLPDPPIVWPVIGHDRATTLEMLRRDLMPDRTEAEMALETEVRDAEARAMTHANRNDVLRGM